MFKKLYVISTITLLCLGFCGAADAREKIVLPYICFPPTYICEKDKCVGGIGWKIYQLIRKNMPEYEYESESECRPLGRSWKLTFSASPATPFASLPIAAVLTLELLLALFLPFRTAPLKRKLLTAVANLNRVESSDCKE